VPSSAAAVFAAPASASAPAAAPACVSFSCPALLPEELLPQPAARAAVIMTAITRLIHFFFTFFVLLSVF
jgi:hypothetical protein